LQFWCKFEGGKCSFFLIKKKEKNLTLYGGKVNINIKAQYVK